MHGFGSWFWAIVILAVFIGIAISSEQKRKVNQRQQMLRTSLLSVVDAMTGTQFEQYFADLLRLRGHRNVQVVGGTGDGGVDILAIAPNGTLGAFQCKRQKANVPVTVVRQLIGSVAHEHPGRVPYLVTTAVLTKPAGDLARGAGVRVIDRPALGIWMDQARSQLGSGGASGASPSIPQDVIDLVRQGRKIQAIKRYREMTGLGLKEAKDVIDQIGPVTPWVAPQSPSYFPQDVIDLVRQGRKIQAIKRYREMTGLGLKEAKDVIDQIR